MFILTGPALYRISFQIKRIWRWLSLEICRMDLFNAGMSDYDLLRYAKQGNNYSAGKSD